MAVDCLFHKFMAMKKPRKERGLSRDMKRCVVCAARTMAEAKKDRRADEFLELVDAMEKNPESKLKSLKDTFSNIPDEAFDMHTLEGRRMSRGLLYWYEQSSKTVNKTSAYEKWHKWFKPLMIEITKAKKELEK